MLLKTDMSLTPDRSTDHAGTQITQVPGTNHSFPTPSKGKNADLTPLPLLQGTLDLLVLEMPVGRRAARLRDRLDGTRSDRRRSLG